MKQWVYCSPGRSRHLYTAAYKETRTVAVYNLKWNILTSISSRQRNAIRVSKQFTNECFTNKVSSITLGTYILKSQSQGQRVNLPYSQQMHRSSTATRTLEYHRHRLVETKNWNKKLQIKRSCIVVANYLTS